MSYCVGVWGVLMTHIKQYFCDNSHGPLSTNINIVSDSVPLCSVWTSCLILFSTEKWHPWRRVCVSHRRGELLGLWQDRHMERPEVKTQIRQCKVSVTKKQIFFLFPGFLNNRNRLSAHGFLSVIIFTFISLHNLYWKVQRRKPLLPGFRHDCKMTVWISEVTLNFKCNPACDGRFQ